MLSRFAAALACLLLLAPTWAFAQEPPPTAQPEEEGSGDVVIDLPQLGWLTEGTGQLGERASLIIPPGLAFIGAESASKLVEMMGNISSKDELGLIGPRDLEWFVVYFFDDIGYVEDDEQDELDADELLSSLRENVKAGNEIRKERGLSTLELVGWAIPPRYNSEDNVLEWATKLKNEKGGMSVNYKTRVLGRKGVMRLILVTAPELLDATLPKFKTMMGGFSFTQGEKYAEFKAGDHVAEIGLAALVVGGAGALAAKTGMFGALLVFMKKGWKLVVGGVVAIGLFFKKIFAKVTGGSVE